MIRTLALLAALACLFAQPAAAQNATATSANQMAASAWSTAYAGTALSLSGYTLAWEPDLTDCSTIGINTSANQPGKNWFAYNGVTYTDQVGTVIYMAPPSPSNSGWSGISPFSCSGSGLAITMQYDNANARWQSGVITSQNPGANGHQITTGYIEFTITMPAASGSLLPDVSGWSKLTTAYANPTIWDEIDLFESYIASSTVATSIQTTFHRWPGTSSPTTLQVVNHTQRPSLWSGTILDGNPHRFGLKKTTTAFIVYSNVGGAMVEVARFPVLSQQDGQPLYALFSISQYFTLVGVPTGSTYTATLSDFKMYTCAAAC